MIGVRNAELYVLKVDKLLKWLVRLKIQEVLEIKIWELPWPV